MLAVALLLASVVAIDGSAQPEIRSVAGQVTIQADNVPLAQILDALSRATGMEVRYEGMRPTNPVTFNVHEIAEAEAIPRLMEGLGLSYVLRTDATGRRVDLLIVTGSGTASAPPTQRARTMAKPALSEEQPEVDPEMIPVDPFALEHPAGRVEPIDLGNPEVALPGQAAPPTGPIDPTRPSGVGMRDMPTPLFPQGVSYPRH